MTPFEMLIGSEVVLFLRAFDLLRGRKGFVDGGLPIGYQLIATGKLGLGQDNSNTRLS